MQKQGLGIHDLCTMSIAGVKQWECCDNSCRLMTVHFDML